MRCKTDRPRPMAGLGDYSDVSELQSLLRPAQVFSHPGEVVNDPDLTLKEKRAILASWASDACSVEAAPALRYAAGGGRKKTVQFDEIMDALQALDQLHEGRTRYRPRARDRRVRAPRDRSRGGNGPDGSGHMLS